MRPCAALAVVLALAAAVVVLAPHASVQAATVPTSAEPQLRYDDLPLGMSRYYTVGSFWKRNALTYRFVSTTGDLADTAQKAAIRQAFDVWSAASALTFTEETNPTAPADIDIRFAVGDHGDGETFDGAGGVLAHAFFPPADGLTGTGLPGDVHFDDAETWTTATRTSSGQPIDLVTVAIHEIGHSLGLGHSSVANSVMYAFYGGSNRTLFADDVAGIQSLYGPNPAGPPPTAPPTTTPPTTAPPTTAPPTTTPPTPDPCIYGEACPFHFGGPGDLAVPADFDGDGRADFAVYRSGTWYIDLNHDGVADRSVQFGAPGDRAYAADSNGDGHADLIIFRGQIGTWFVDTNLDGVPDATIHYASPGDLPYIGDFNNDGRIDLGIFRPSEGNWYVDTNGDGFGDIVEHYASPGDVPAPADYDHNASIDYAIFRPSNGCYFINDAHFHSGFTGTLPNGFATTVIGFASPGDQMAAGDYAGTGTTQLAIFRPNTGTWWIRNAAWNHPRGDESTACR